MNHFGVKVADKSKMHEAHASPRELSVEDNSRIGISGAQQAVLGLRSGCWLRCNSRRANCQAEIAHKLIIAAV